MAYFKARVGGSGAETPTLLWTNPNPNSAFSLSQTISINLTDYNYILIESKNRVDKSTNFIFRTIVQKDLNQTRWTCIGGDSDGKGNPLYRNFVINNNSIVFTGGAGANFNVPINIYGIKSI